MKKKEAKYPLVVTVTPNANPDYPSHAGVEARLKLTEGEAVFAFVPVNIMDKDLAATIGKALEGRNLREVKFESDTGGQIWVMWKGQSFPVAFFVSVQGPEYLYRRAKDALREQKSRDL